jgi:Pentapeptide repeats (9 copies)
MISFCIVLFCLCPRLPLMINSSILVKVVGERLPKCTYEYRLGPYESIPPEIPLDCKEQSAENNEYCIFHDTAYYTEHEQEAVKRFEEKVRKSINQNEPLLCFGCYLPGIDFANLLEGKGFAQRVYFNEATFSEEANFERATFTERANFSDVKFSKEAIFGKATFTGEYRL